MKEHQGLTKSQRLVMEVIWKLGEVNNSTVLKELSDIRTWSRHTVKTYLKQLVEKGLVGERQLSPRRYYYYPLITKDDFLADETSAYLKKNFDGLSYLVAGLVERERISKDEIGKLEQIIKEYKENSND
jgi:BlaI family penicillinase repressor